MLSFCNFVEKIWVATKKPQLHKHQDTPFSKGHHRAEVRPLGCSIASRSLLVWTSWQPSKGNGNGSYGRAGAPPLSLLSLPSASAKQVTSQPTNQKQWMSSKCNLYFKNLLRVKQWSQLLIKSKRESEDEGGLQIKHAPRNKPKQNNFTFQKKFSLNAAQHLCVFYISCGDVNRLTFYEYSSICIHMYKPIRLNII